jgi:hypothetical protein
MATLLDMTLGKSKQISVQSSPTCDTALNALAWDLDQAGVTYLGGKVSRQAVVNGMLLWLAGLEERERREILGKGLRSLENLILKRPLDGEDDERLRALSRAYLAAIGEEEPHPRQLEIKYSDTNIPIPRKRKGPGGKGGEKG